MALSLLCAACEEKDIVISNNRPGSWAEIRNESNEIIVARLDYGKTASVPAEGVATYRSSDGSGTNHILLTARGFRQSDNCSLGTNKYETYISFGGGATGLDVASWEIRYFDPDICVRQ